MAKGEETEKARYAFNDYLAMGPQRSLAKLSAGAGPSGASYRLATLESWSSQFNWQARISDHDRAMGQALVEQADAERDKQREGRRLDRLQTAELARKLATAILEAKQDPDIIRRQSLFAAKELLDYADNAERLDLGEPTQRVEHSGPGGSDLFRIVRVDSNYRPANTNVDAGESGTTTTTKVAELPDHRGDTLDGTFREVPQLSA